MFFFGFFFGGGAMVGSKPRKVATLNPCDPALPETISTCRFAQRVANVGTPKLPWLGGIGLVWYVWLK